MKILLKMLSLTSRGGGRDVLGMDPMAGMRMKSDDGSDTLTNG